MLTKLLSVRRFAALFWCQFFSAFNDNLLKNALVTLIVYVLAKKDAPLLVQLAGAIFILPSFLLSGLGGQLADRYDKSLIARRLKFGELFAAGFAAVGFYFHSVPILMTALGLFGTIAALFGPIKYGILPDHLKTEELPGGNALIEGATFLAILLGTIVGTKAMTGDENRLVISALIMVFAIACWLSSRLIPSTREADPKLAIDGNILKSTFELISTLYKTQILWRGTMVVGWFWLVGATTLPLLSTLVKDRMGGTPNLYIVAMVLFSVGVAIGSLLAAWIAHGRIILLPTPVAAILMGFFGLDLGFATLGSAPVEHAINILTFFSTFHGWRVGLDLLGFSIAGGLYIVPFFAAIQVWAGEQRRARVIAAGNVIAAGFMVVGSVVSGALQDKGVTEPQVLIGIGVLNLIIGVLIFRLLPIKAFKDFASIFYRTLFRLEIKGLENIDKAGPNPIIALNHVSFLDAALALSLTDRNPVFAIDSVVAKSWLVKPFLHFVRAMALDPTNPMATRTLIHAVQGGETLIIFPEGRLTVTGSLMKVYDGAGLIADKSNAMIVPVRIDGLQATPFSKLSPEQVRRRWFPKVTVTVLEPVKLNVKPELKGKVRRQAAGAALYGVMSDLVFRTTSTDHSIIDAVIAAAHEHGPNRIAIEDPVAGKFSYKQLLIRSSVLGRKLMPLAAEGEAMGIMLPNSNGAAATILATMSAGRVPAMINFSAGPVNIHSACKAAEIKTIVTSRLFIEKARLGPLAETLSKVVQLVYLEDLREHITRLDKLRGLLCWKKPLIPRKPDDRGAILFTSGSEGTPKGV
ncbi:MAG: MFS transporter, partial [Chthoniobacterales bacterium]